jgi:ribonuclease BN (tRNA processing enzyme)
MRVTCLGTGDAFFGGGRGHSALLVDDGGGRILVDCGASVPLALKRLGVPAASIDAVVFTHLHGDHTAGFPFLILGGMYDERRTRPLLVAGPPRTERHTEALFRALYPDIVSERPFAIEYRELAPGGTLEAAGRRLAAFPAHHMGGEWTALAWRIESEGKVLAVSGDTGPAAPLAGIAAGADLFVCECTMAGGAAYDKHMSVADVARLRPSWTARRVVLTHFSAPAREEARGLAGVELGDDLATFEV